MSREYGFQPCTIARCHFTQCVLLALVLLGGCLVMSSCDFTLTSQPGPSATPPSDPSHVSITATVVPTQPIDKTRITTPTPVALSDQQVVVNFIKHYVDLVFSQLFRRAYTKLSAGLRDSVPYEDFVQNHNYTLSKGCWREGQSQVSQLDDHTWVEGIEMMQVSCVDGNVMVKYSWVFHINLADGAPEIITVGLYPTGAGS